MRKLLSAIVVCSSVLVMACGIWSTDPLDPLPNDVRAFLQANPRLEVRRSTAVELTSTSVGVFRVSYGPPMDCPSGCIYASAVVVRAGGRIGWVTDVGTTPDSRLFPVLTQDTLVFTQPLLAELRRRDVRAHSSLAFTLVCSPNTSDAVRERLRRDTPTLLPASYCPTP